MDPCQHNGRKVPGEVLSKRLLSCRGEDQLELHASSIYRWTLGRVCPSFFPTPVLYKIKQVALQIISNLDSDAVSKLKDCLRKLNQRLARFSQHC